MADSRIKAVQFDEENHKYFFDGKVLSGVTGAIGKLVGKSFPDNDTVMLATLYGSNVHKEVENYYNNAGILSTEGAKWVTEELSHFSDSLSEDKITSIECEVMVSDFEGTASKVDVVMHTQKGVYLFDIKTTSHFDREYCSLQLNTYKKLYEQCYDEKVLGLFVLSTKSKRRFKILDSHYDDKVNKILDMNRG